MIQVKVVIIMLKYLIVINVLNRMVLFINAQRMEKIVKIMVNQIILL